MLMADLRHDYVRTVLHGRSTAQISPSSTRSRASWSPPPACGSIARECPRPEPVLRHALEVRYTGQDASIPVTVDADLLARGDRAAVAAAFNEIHQRTFGYHDRAQALEIVSVRLAAIAKRAGERSPDAFTLPTADDGARGLAQPGSRPVQPIGSRVVWFDAALECPVYLRDRMPAGTQIGGPAVVQEYASTTLVFPGDRLEVKPTGEMLLHLGDA